MKENMLEVLMYLFENYMIEGNEFEPDQEILSTTARLYRDVDLRRAYFSAFQPVRGTPFDGHEPTPAWREHRLYQADFLLRDYGWNVEDLPFTQATNLRLDVDPKRAWADEHLREAPVEVNRASRSELLRIPGIGPKLADRILGARRRAALRDLASLRALGVRNVEMLSPYVLLDGRQPARQLGFFAL